MKRIVINKMVRLIMNKNDTVMKMRADYKDICVILAEPGLSFPAEKHENSLVW